MKIYQRIARAFNAMLNCQKTGNVEWETNHFNTIYELVRDSAPSGSGVDSGTQFDYDSSKENKLVFNTAYHHMNDGGFYDGWSEHKVIITPDLASGFNMRITGIDRNQIKDYLSDLYYHWLNSEVIE